MIAAGADPASIPDKVYFKIGEVARLVGVEPHVLRYWEREVKAIRPEKTRSRQRRYRRKDVALFFEVRRLLHDEKFTLAGVKKRVIVAARTLDDEGRAIDAAPAPGATSPAAAEPTSPAAAEPMSPVAAEPTSPAAAEPSLSARVATTPPSAAAPTSPVAAESTQARDPEAQSARLRVRQGLEALIALSAINPE